MAMETEKTEQQLLSELALLEEQRKEVDQRLREQQAILGRGRGLPGNRPPGRGGGWGGVYARGRGGLMPQGGLGRPMRDPPNQDYVRRPVLRDPAEDAAARKRLSSAVVVGEAGTDGAPPLKRRQLSSVVARGDGRGPPEVSELRTDPESRGGEEAAEPGEVRGEPQHHQQRNGPRRNFLARDGMGPNKYDPPEESEAAAVPRVVPEMAAPEIKRSRRLFGALLGTLAQFRKEDEKEKTSDAHQKRVNSLQRADERTKELRDKARQLEREAAQAKREKDIVLRNRLAAKVDEKQLEILFLKWTAHERKLTGFLRTKTEPHIFYVPAKHNKTTEKLFDVRQQEFEERKRSRRAELTEYEQRLQEEALRVPESTRWGAGASKGPVAPESVGVQKMEVEGGERGADTQNEAHAHEDLAHDDATGANGEGEGDQNGVTEQEKRAPRVKSKSERLNKIEDSDDEEEGYDPTDLDKLLVGEEPDDEL